MSPPGDRSGKKIRILCCRVSHETFVMSARVDAFTLERSLLLVFSNCASLFPVHAAAQAVGQPGAAGKSFTVINANGEHPTQDDWDRLFADL